MTRSGKMKAPRDDVVGDAREQLVEPVYHTDLVLWFDDAPSGKRTSETARMTALKASKHTTCFPSPCMHRVTDQ